MNHDTLQASPEAELTKAVKEWQEALAEKSMCPFSMKDLAQKVSESQANLKRLEEERVRVLSRLNEEIEREDKNLEQAKESLATQECREAAYRSALRRMQTCVNSQSL